WIDEAEYQIRPLRPPGEAATPRPADHQDAAVARLGDRLGPRARRPGRIDQLAERPSRRATRCVSDHDPDETRFAVPRMSDDPAREAVLRRVPGAGPESLAAKPPFSRLLGQEPIGQPDRELLQHRPGRRLAQDSRRGRSSPGVLMRAEAVE